MNYEELTLINFEDFLSRFNRCFDGLIEEVLISYPDGARWPEVSISIQTQDEQSEDEWAILHLRLKKVTNLRMTEGKVSYRVLSDGLVLKRFDASWGIGFDEDQESSESAEAFASSPFGFIAEKVEWATS